MNDAPCKRNVLADVERRGEHSIHSDIFRERLPNTCCAQAPARTVAYCKENQEMSVLNATKE
jgi:hypothetical protein